MKRLLKNSFGIIFLVVGSLGTVFGLIGFIDPVGSKLSDDTAPFGAPASFSESLFDLLFYTLVLACGFWLLRSAHKNREPANQALKRTG